ncbi:hypothetical protein [Selenomonas ruminantium]|uniref:hypothetical protein n=1 Tax=Selenomonas ruminantium TaxID=971 RepID=UPI0026F2E219|nr:hypothetical protein [Selenomonas ruminantium]
MKKIKTNMCDCCKEIWNQCNISEVSLGERSLYLCPDCFKEFKALTNLPESYLMISEFEKDNDERRVDVKIKNLTVEDICFSVGALLREITEENFDNKLERLFFKLQAVQDICTMLDLKPIAKSIENAINQAKKLQ